MTVPIVLIIVGVILALIDEFQDNGRSLLGWAVVFIGAALLWGHLG